jgi:hypothetical protein
MKNPTDAQMLDWLATRTVTVTYASSTWRINGGPPMLGMASCAFPAGLSRKNIRGMMRTEKRYVRRGVEEAGR